MAFMATALLSIGAARAADADTRAQESGSGYTFVDLAAFRVQGGGDASTVRGSVELGTRGLYATAGHYRVHSPDEGRYRIDSLGLGYYVAASDTWDIMAEASHDRARGDDGSSRSNAVGVGATGTFGESFEATVMVNRYFGGDLESSSDTAYLAVQQMLATNLAVVADVEFGDGDTWYGLGLRYFIH